MPRSRSSSIESSICGRCLRASTAPVTSRMRSASVDLPWSMWAMIEKFRMLLAGARMCLRMILGTAEPTAHKSRDLAGLLEAHREHGGDVDRDADDEAGAEARDLGDQRAAQQLVERVPDAVCRARQRRG